MMAGGERFSAGRNHCGLVNACPGQEVVMAGVVVCLAVLAAATVGGLVFRARQGRMRVRGRDAVRRLTEREIGGPLGERATLVQFSTAFCAPCRATRRTLGEVAAMVEGVTHVEIDAEGRLDLVRDLSVLKTPTVLVLDGTGAVVRRAAGQPRKADVIAAIGAAVDGAAPA
jgi:thiol-disulfide isomerase/thioredoxin